MFNLLLCQFVHFKVESSIAGCFTGRRSWLETQAFVPNQSLAKFVGWMKSSNDQQI
jgi:hypothetical protein